MSTVYLPIEYSTICGHDESSFMLCGREQSSFYHKIDDIEYIGMLEEGPCKICNNRLRNRMKRQAIKKHKERYEEENEL